MSDTPPLPKALAPYAALVTDPVRLDMVLLPRPVKEDALAMLPPVDALSERLSAWGYDALPPGPIGQSLLLTGPPGVGKTLLATALADHLGRPLLRVRCGALGRAAGGAAALVTELADEAAARDAVLLFDDCDERFVTGAPETAALLMLLARRADVTLLAAQRGERLDPALARQVLFHAALPAPDAELREQLWELYLPPGVPIVDDVDIPTLANLYEFTGGTIRAAVLVALNRALALDPAKPRVDMAGLRAAADVQLAAALDASSRGPSSRASLDSLVLPEEQRAALAAILAACRQHTHVTNAWSFGRRLAGGRGLVILFDGPPGTGKTLCAEVLASELGRALLRVDARSLGDLHGAFARAQASHALLLFDEADVPFSRRVDDAAAATDREANLAVSLLLQEVDRFDGILVLTTSLYGRLDEALRRRILYRVTLPEPGARERARIWQAVVPWQAPTAPDIDCDKLGRVFELPGRHIRNAALRAACAAAAESGPINQAHLEEAASVECRAAGVLHRLGEWASPRQTGRPAPSPVKR
jgi:SpoVK/Ycf46/Vps4 family AAA+-type ATPase